MMKITLNRFLACSESVPRRGSCYENVTGSPGLHENGAADSVVDLVLSHAGTWFCAQLPLGVPVGLIIAGVIILMRSTRGKGNNV